ncbi:protein RSN1 [Colletotrichum shisoi]|uniref:Protein RSN1 n=1 Tax=Colletotrichum shisoi TaxID=2078593 RepID=A0A5Q4BCN8_9PEZI|nr:protein RSN1 [Colletotrichum shisoi]
MSTLDDLQSGQDNRGEALGDESGSSISGLVSTLAVCAPIAGVYLVIFLILRRSQRRFYAPRTYLGSLREGERSPSLPSGIFNWFAHFWKIPDIYALKHQSLDSYLFLRFLRICATICLVGLIMTWPVLFPVNATGGGTAQQLDILTYSNIDVTVSSGLNRLYAHALIGWLFYGFVMYLIMRECIFYINLRQAFLLSPTYAKRISSRTVLFTSVPDAYLDEAKFKKLFSESIKRVWITGDTEKLDELVEERDKVAMKLEKAQVKLIKLANAARLKAVKNGASADKTPSAQDTESGDAAARWIPQKKRPTHRLGLLGLVGRKVDTIEWCRAELQRLIPAVDAAQAEYRAGKYNKVPAVFAEFYTQSDAQAAFQVTTHHQALQMTPKYIGIQPTEVIWKSLRVSWWQKVVRRYAVIAFIAALIIFWAIPVTIVGIISQVSYLEKVSFLTWLQKIPDVIMGVVSGLLPSVALAVLMSLVPVIMRLCAKLSGEPSDSRVELFTQNAYYWFQLIQVFLITTISGSAIATIQAIAENPGSIFGTLSTALPKSYSFYISYFIVQGITLAVGVLTQVVAFAIFVAVLKFLTNTPRALYQKWSTLAAISWGSVLPVYTTIAVISITYAIIAPLMLFFSTLGMGLFYLSYRYNILFVTDTRIDTRGLLYPRALKQLFAGVYLAEICLIGLFAVSVAIGPLVLMIIFLIFSVLFHLTMNSVLDPLMYTLPRTLQVEEESLSAEIEGIDRKDSGRGVSEEQKGDSSNLFKKIPNFKKFSPGGEENTVEKGGNIVTRFLKPWIFADYLTLRQLVPHDAATIDEMYPGAIQDNAYYPPSVSSLPPLLWIPEDSAGVSKYEIAQTSKIIPITDEGCQLDEKNKLVWDSEGARPPIWDEKIYY